jgi:choline dehydrogenase
VACYACAIATYDFIIVGAGSAGCVLAGRLTSDPSVSVLLLEAGTAREPLLARVPAVFPKLFKTRHDWAYFTEPEPALATRRLYIPRGKLLGGSSAMNAMIYVRGNALDYDGWAASGADGWSHAEVLPYFLKAEDQQRRDLPGHGKDGPLRVEDLSCKNPLSSAFVEACGQVGVARTGDFNGPSQDGAGFYQVTQKAGRRWSAANAYLFPAMKRHNLDLRRGAHALRVVFQGRRATGVEYFERGRRHTARAHREVLLCAGAIGSPQLLLLSGVGPADELARLGIPTVHPLDGVGKNLQDHPTVGIAFACKEPISLRNLERPASLLQYIAARKGPLTSNVAEAGAFVRSGPDQKAPDLQFHFVPMLYLDHGLRRPKIHGFSFGPAFLCPKSRGRVTLASADPFAPPRIFGNHLSHPSEMKALVFGLRFARTIAEAQAFDRYRGAEYPPGAPPRTDAELEARVRASVELLYHPSGTCKMGKDQLAVVDPELRVHGLEGLRVADASVMPVIVRGNTNAPTIMIAERLAAWLGPR